MRRSNGESSERTSSAETRCQPWARPAHASSKANAHSPLRLVHSERRNCGRGYSGRGMPSWPRLALPEMVDLRGDVAVVDLAPEGPGPEAHLRDPHTRLSPVSVLQTLSFLQPPEPSSGRPFRPMTSVY